MKILKVVVDELPNSCNVCPYSMPLGEFVPNNDKYQYFCLSKNMEKPEDIQLLTMKNMLFQCPPWCPLVKDNSC